MPLTESTYEPPTGLPRQISTRLRHVANETPRPTLRLTRLICSQFKTAITRRIRHSYPNFPNASLDLVKGKYT